MEAKPKTKSEIADHFGVTPRTIEVWMRNGLIPFWKIGHLVRFDLASVEQHLDLHHRHGPVRPG